MRYTLLITILLVGLISCKKDKFTTRPQLKVTSINPSHVAQGGTLQFKLEFTDAEGDFTSFLGVKKTVANCTLSSFIDSNKYKVPTFPSTKNQLGTIVLNLDYNFDGLAPRCNKPDTAVYRFWIKDQAGNVSDTAVANPVIISN